MVEDVFRITFRQYFWTPLPFLFLIVIAILEGYIAVRLLNNKVLNARIILVLFISNIIGYFIEYNLSLLLNGGHIILVWIPWVKIIGTQDLINYILSFPLIFITTLLIESSINLVLLKKHFPFMKLFKTAIWTNLISLILLVITFNLIIFNFIKGEEVGTIGDILPPIR